MSRNGFNDCEREYNARQEAIEMAKNQREPAEDSHLSGQADRPETPTSRSQQEVSAQSGSHPQQERELADYKLWAEVEIADLREDLSDHIRMAKEAQEELAEATAIWKGNMQLFSAKAELAEARVAALEEALSQMLDDMGVDGFCVCPAAKEQAIAAMGEKK